ncbi:MAG: extracellular solute-binding protein [Chloroflexi bacterium]|nr:extracellular solute-binding protein [Chloroflexota bacterium]
MARVISRRTLFSTLGLTAGIGLLQACGGAPASPTVAPKAAEPTKPAAAAPTTALAAPPTAPAAAPTTAPAAAKPAASGSGGSFTFFQYEWEGHGVGLSRRWTVPGDAFEQETGIKIGRKSIPSTQYWDKMITELASGTTTELYYARYNAIDQYLAMGALAPLDAVADVKLFTDTFYPIQKDEFIRDGKTIAYLCGITSSAMFYNKKLFDAAGLKAPTTYAELLDVAKKLTKAPNQYGMGIPTADQVQIGEPIGRFLVGHGTLWGKDKEVMANSAKNVEAYEAMKGLVDAGVTPTNQNNPVLRPMFWEQKSAIWWDGPWFPGMSPNPIEGLASAKIPLPSGKTTGGPQIIIMAKAAANKEAAGKYLNFISQPQWQKAMTVESGINSGRVKDVDYADYLAKNPWYQPFLDAMPTAVTNIAPGWDLFNAQYTKVIQSKTAEMYSKNRPVKAVLDEIQAELEKLVKDNLK